MMEEKNKTKRLEIIKQLLIIIGLFIILSFISITVSASTEGLLGSYTTSTYEYDAQEGLYQDAIVVGEDSTYVYYAIVCTGDTGTENDGYLRTVKVVKSSGLITASIIESLEFDTSDCYYPSICYCGTNGGLYYYAICYTDTGASKQTIVTVSISITGDIGNAVIDTQTMSYDGADASGSCEILKLSGTTYVICYTVSDYDGWLETYTISDAGVITNAVIDTQEFDAADGRFPQMCLLDSDTVAIIYGGTDTAAGASFDGFICTYNISSGGTITNTAADSWEYDANQGTQPDIARVGQYCLIAWEGLDGDGYIGSLVISDAGKITKVLASSLEHDTADSGFNKLYYVGDTYDNALDIYALTYQGSSGDGFIKTFAYATASVTQRDVYEYDTADSLNYAPVLFVNYTWWCIFYASTGNDGFMKTVSIDNEYGLTLYDSLSNTTGTHQYQIGDKGYTVWANYTGDTTPIHQTENLDHATGSNDYILNSTGYWIWENYTGDTPSLIKYQNIVDATGTHESQWNPVDFVFNVWANYTGDAGSPLQLYLFENIINATGTHDWSQNDTGYLVYANYTGNGTGGSVTIISGGQKPMMNGVVIGFGCLCVGSIAGGFMFGKRKKKEVTRIESIDER